jgi:hypothetical protein
MAEQATYQARLAAEDESRVQRVAEAWGEHADVITRADGTVLLRAVEEGGRTIYVRLGHMQHAQLMSDLFVAWEARKS